MIMIFFNKTYFLHYYFCCILHVWNKALNQSISQSKCCPPVSSCRFKLLSGYFTQNQSDCCSASISLLTSNFRTKFNGSPSKSCQYISGLSKEEEQLFASKSLGLVVDGGEYWPPVVNFQPDHITKRTTSPQIFPSQTVVTSNADQTILQEDDGVIFALWKNLYEVSKSHS